ncbi:precorrin-6A synthase (deacetylating) [Streptodolium elevatio]
MTVARRHVLVIGMGAGDPEHLTLAAVAALGRTDVFFVLDKGPEKDSLVRARRDILDRHAKADHRLVGIRDPERRRDVADTPAYHAAVRVWRERRTDAYERAVRDELAPGECGAVLVWGDPALYDGTIDILDDVAARGGVDFDYEVIPGISSVSALAARHRTTLTQVGRPLHITPGRYFTEELADLTGSGGDIAVMLDAHQAFTRLPGDDMWIYWGAYVGTPDEILVSGRLSDVADRIVALRAEARARHGWIMDAYLLRPCRDDPAEEPPGT